MKRVKWHITVFNEKGDNLSRSKTFDDPLVVFQRAELDIRDMFKSAPVSSLVYEDENERTVIIGSKLLANSIVIISKEEYEKE